MPASNGSPDQNYWDLRSTGYNDLRWVHNGDLLTWTADAFRATLPHHIDAPSVLEIGPGTGALTQRLAPLIAERRGQYTAAEVSPGMCDLFDVRGVDLLNMSWQQVEATGRKFDAIVARMVLRHEQIPRNALQRWARMLNRGGILFIAEGPPPSHDIDVRLFYDAVMNLKHGDLRVPLYASEIVDYALDLSMRTTCFETFSEGNSLNEWLTAGRVPAKRAAQVKSLHANCSSIVRDAYRMRDTGNDLLMRWRHCVVAAESV